jgi:integrase
MRYPSIKLDFHGGKWRIREYLAPGNPPTTSYYGTREEGEAHKRDFEAEAGQLTIGQAVRDFLDHLRRFGGPRSKGLKSSGLKMRETKLVHLLALVDRKEMKHQRGKRNQQRVYHDLPIEELTPAHAQRCYSKLVALEAAGEMAAATHQGYLIAGKGFGEWLRACGITKVNVFEEVKAEGVANTRKDRLRLDEARKLIAVCYEDPHPMGGIAVAAMLTLGTRSHELLEREVYDLDAMGTKLVIERSKSKAGERSVTLPLVIRAKLRQLCEGQPPGARIFRGMANNTLLEHVKRLCEVAGVNVITAHGLRDTWTDLTMDVAKQIDKTATDMGHADSNVTRRHYLSASVERSMRAAMMEELLFSAETENGESEEEMIAREEREMEEKLAALKARKAGLNAAQPATKVALPVGPAIETPVPHLKVV